MLRSIVALTLLGLSASAVAPFPAYFTLPAAMSIPDPNRTVEEGYSEAYMPFADNDNLKRGRHVSSRLQFAGVEFTDDNSWRPKVWNPIRQALTAGGWVVKDYQDTNPPMATLQYQRGGIEAWTRMQLFSPEQIEIEFIEVKPFTPTLTLPAPATTPEKVGESAPFPFLLPLPGARTGSVDPDNGPMYVTFKDEEQPTMVATNSIKKDYHDLQAISNLQFVLEYNAALTKAGWQIVAQSQGINQSDATLTAHYAKNGRDIWAYMHFGGDLSISVGEAGDLAAALAKSCHVPIYGITFDFNKTSIRPDSDAALQKIVTLLQQDAPLKIEVQGHTDNVGGDDYNQKLSQGRADAVKTWLVAHGTTADRVTTRGYGRQQPIADNTSDEGRAKNRRVEVAKAGCNK
jgi:OOP family OmpA-OmpF porin